MHVMGAIGYEDRRLGTQSAPGTLLYLDAVGLAKTTNNGLTPGDFADWASPST